jgi:hypothetical protein
MALIGGAVAGDELDLAGERRAQRLRDAQPSKPPDTPVAEPVTQPLRISAGDMSPMLAS